MDKNTNSHVNIDDKETKLLIIASIETFKRQNKNCCKDEVFALVKDSLEEAITMVSLKSLGLLQVSHSIKYNIISNRTCLSIPKHSYKQLITNNYKIQKPSSARKAKIKILQDASAIKQKKTRRLNKRKIYLRRPTKTSQS